MQRMLPLAAVAVLLFAGNAGIHGQAKSVPEISVPMLIEKLKSDDAIVRLQAVKALRMLGQKAEAAKAALTKAAESDPDSDVRRLAAAALRGLTTLEAPGDSVTLILDKLRSTNAAVRLGAVKYLKMSSVLADRVRLFLELLADKDPDVDVRGLAQEVLSHLAREAAKAKAEAAAEKAKAVVAAAKAAAEDDSIRSMIDDLQSEDAGVRLEAIKSLKDLGDKAKAAKAALIKAADHDPDADVRWLAKEGLRALSRPEAPEARRLAKVGLKLATHEVLAPDVKPLFEKLQNNDPVVRLGAVKDLKEMRQGAKTALRALMQVADADADEDVRELARESIGPVMPADELAKTDARIAAINQQLDGLKSTVELLKLTKHDAELKVLNAFRQPPPDLAVVSINQNAVTVNMAKIAIEEQEMARFQLELASLEKFRAHLEDAKMHSGRK